MHNYEKMWVMVHFCISVCECPVLWYTVTEHTVHNRRGWCLLDDFITAVVHLHNNVLCSSQTFIQHFPSMICQLTQPKSYPLSDPYTTSMSILKTIFAEYYIPKLTAKRLIKACKDLLMQTDMWHMHNNTAKKLCPLLFHTQMQTHIHMGLKDFQ